MPAFKDEVRARNYSTGNPQKEHEIHCPRCGRVHDVPPGKFEDCPCGTKLSRISGTTLLIEGVTRKKGEVNRGRVGK